MNNGYRRKDRYFWSRVISILLLIVMLSEEFIGSGNIVMAAGTGETVVTEQSEAEVSETVENADDMEVLFEMEEKREQRAKHYRLSDGSIMAADYGMDIHYQKNGQWENIDNRFVYEAASEADDMSGFSTAEGAVEFKFAPDTSNGEVVRTSDGAYSVSFEFLGEAVRSERSDSINSDTAESISEDIEMEDAVSVGNEDTLETGISGENTTVPITFVKGDLLNADAAMEALSGTAAEDSVQIFTEDPSQEIMAVSGLLASADDVTEDSDNVQNSNIESSQSKVDWVEVGTEQTGIADDTLMQQTVLENIVTSVGYANVLAGVSLQYVARGNSLKEYILIDQQQENYDYIFRMNLTHLVPAMRVLGM